MEIAFSDFEINNKIFSKKGIYGLFDKESKFIYKNFYNIKKLSCPKTISVKKYLGYLNTKIVNELLEEFELDKNILKKKLGDLSNGELIKIYIIKLIIIEPKLIILDNIEIYLPEKDLKTIFRLLKNKQKSKNITILYKSENIDTLIALTDNYIFIKDEQIIFNGKDLEKLPEKTEMMKFVDMANKKNASLNYYKEYNDLLKAIYRSVKK